MLVETLQRQGAPKAQNEAILVIESVLSCDHKLIVKQFVIDSVLRFDLLSRNLVLALKQRVKQETTVKSLFRILQLQLEFKPDSA